MLQLPYIGEHPQNEKDYTEPFYMASIYLVLEPYGLSLEEWGRLMVKIYENKGKRAPGFVFKLVYKLLDKKLTQKLLIQKFLCRMCAKSKEAHEKYEYAFEFEYEEPDGQYCVKCN